MAAFGTAFGAQPAQQNFNPNKDIEVTSPPDDSVSSMCFSPTANLLVATSWDNQVSILLRRIIVPLVLQQGRARRVSKAHVLQGTAGRAIVQGSAGRPCRLASGRMQRRAEMRKPPPQGFFPDEKF